MRKTIATVLRACGLVFALYWLSGGPLLADGPTHCAASAVGAQTGQDYTLSYQSLVTETHNGTLSVGGGGCPVQLSEGTTEAEQYYVGYYVNQVTNQVARVDCRTGRVTGWV
jgi:hypothetical protein